MPTTTCRTLPSEIVWPTIRGSPPKRRLHKPWLRIATRRPLGRSSSAVNARPCSSGARNSRKNSAVTRATGMCSASVPPVRFTNSRRWADTSSNTDVCWRQISKTWAPVIEVEALPVVVTNRTSVAAPGVLSGRSSTAFATEKIATFAPIPNVSVRIATAAKAGCRRMLRNA